MYACFGQKPQLCRQARPGQAMYKRFHFPFSCLANNTFSREPIVFDSRQVTCKEREILRTITSGSEMCRLTTCSLVVVKEL